VNTNAIRSPARWVSRPPWSCSSIAAVTGYLIVSIVGAWGFAAVPKPVERACIDTVRSMLQRDPGNWMQATSADGQGIAATPQGTYAIPASARRWLDPYRRYGVIG